MRKDVKLGLAIGGVLILVVLVYTIVIPHHKNEPGAQLTGGNPAEQQTPADSSGGGAPTAINVPNHTGTADLTPAATTVPAVPDQSALTPPPVAADSTHAGAPAQGDPWTVLSTGQFVDKNSLPVHQADMSPAEKLDNGGDKTPAGPTDATAPLTTETPTAPAPAPADPGTPAAVPVADASHPDADQIILAAHNVGTTQPAGQRTHVIRSGETFSSIAAAAYGNAKYYLAIAKANPTVNPSKMRPGTEIILPEITEARPAETPAAPTTRPAGEALPPVSAAPVAPIDAAKQYEVKNGDSLYKISEKLYGDAKHVDEIYQANKDAIGPNPEKLKLGMILKLTTAPTKS